MKIAKWYTRWVNKLMNGQTDRWMGGRTDEWRTDGYMKDGWIDGRMDG